MDADTIASLRVAIDKFNNDNKTSELADLDIKFRSYEPLSKAIRERCTLAERDDLSDLNSAEVLDKLLNEDNGKVHDIVPKHPNWDLKVSIEKKMKKLNKRTHKAIVEILKSSAD